MTSSSTPLRDLQIGLDRIPRAGPGEIELYVVDSSWLAPIITDALQKMRDEEHPRGFHSLDVYEVAPQMWLAASLHTSTRRIYRITRGQGLVGLSFADALLLALGLEHLSAEMPLFPNPRIPRKRWIARAKAAGVRYAKREYDELLSAHMATLRSASDSVTAPD